MKCIRKWAFGIVILILALGVIFLLSKDAIAKRILVHQIRARTKLEARLERVSVGLLTPVLSVEGLRIYKPAGQGGTLVLDAPELHVEYDRRALADRRVRLKLVRLRIAELNLVRGGASPTNLFPMNWKSPVPASGPTQRTPFPEIEVLDLSVGRVLVLDLQQPQRNREFRANLEHQIFRNIKTRDDLRGVLFLLWLRSGGEPAATDSGLKSAP